MRQFKNDTLLQKKEINENINDMNFIKTFQKLRKERNAVACTSFRKNKGKNYYGVKKYEEIQTPETMIRNLYKEIEYTIKKEANLEILKIKLKKRTKKQFGLSIGLIIKNINLIFEQILKVKRKAEKDLEDKDQQEISSYEKQLQKLEAEVRQHIRIEQQLKLYGESQQQKVEASEKQRKIEAGKFKEQIALLKADNYEYSCMLKELKQNSKILETNAGIYKKQIKNMSKKIKEMSCKIQQLKFPQKYEKIQCLPLKSSLTKRLSKRKNSVSRSRTSLTSITSPLKRKSIQLLQEIDQNIGLQQQISQRYKDHPKREQREKKAFFKKSVKRQSTQRGGLNSYRPPKRHHLSEYSQNLFNNTAVQKENQDVNTQRVHQSQPSMNPFKNLAQKLKQKYQLNQNANDKFQMKHNASVTTSQSEQILKRKAFRHNSVLKLNKNQYKNGKIRRKQNSVSHSRNDVNAFGNYEIQNKSQFKVKNGDCNRYTERSQSLDISKKQVRYPKLKQRKQERSRSRNSRQRTSLNYNRNLKFQ